jgi:hypothetical protein
LIGGDASGLMRASSPPDRVADLEGCDDLNSDGPLIGDRASGPNSTLELIHLSAASTNSGLIGVAA